MTRYSAILLLLFPFVVMPAQNQAMQIACARDDYFCIIREDRVGSSAGSGVINKEAPSSFNERGSVPAKPSRDYGGSSYEYNYNKGSPNNSR